MLQALICALVSSGAQKFLITVGAKAATLMERESIEGLAATPSNGFPGSSRNSQYGPLATLFMIPSMRRNF